MDKTDYRTLLAMTSLIMAQLLDMDARPVWELVFLSLALWLMARNVWEMLVAWRNRPRIEMLRRVPDEDPMEERPNIP